MSERDRMQAVYWETAISSKPDLGSASSLPVGSQCLHPARDAQSRDLRAV